MGELITGIPKELQQVKNALPTLKHLGFTIARDIAVSKWPLNKLGIKRDPNIPNSMQAVALVGFASVIPDQVEASGILKNPAKIAVLNTLEQYMVVLNDQLDFEGAGREDFSGIVEQIHGVEKERKAKLEQAVAALHVNEQEWVRQNIHATIGEVGFVEDWIRQKQTGNNMSFADVDIYRSTVNAICEVTAAAIIFGPAQLHEKVAPIKDPTSIQKVIDKYAWIMGRYPQNELERALMVAFNVCQIGQIIDDRKGLAIDEILRVPTYARGALKVAAGDKKVAKALLDSKTAEFKDKAIELDAGRITGGLMTGICTAAQVALNGIPELGRRYKPVRQILGNLHLGLREELYMKGKI